MNRLCARRRLRRKVIGAVAPIVLFFAIAIVSTVWAQVPDELVSYPDMIFTNGKILTVDKNFSIVEALAIRNGRILAVGATASMQRLAGPRTQRLDLQGKTMIHALMTMVGGKIVYQDRSFTTSQP